MLYYYKTILEIRNDLDIDHADLVERFKNGELSHEQFIKQSEELLDLYEKHILRLEEQELVHDET